MDLRAGIDLVKDATNAFFQDKAPRLGAALAYYSVFSMAPLLVIVIAVAGLVFGQEAAQGQIVQAIQGLVGRQGAEVIQTMIANTRHTGANFAASLIGVAVLLFGAAGLFGQLKDALNSVWEVQPKPGRGILATVLSQFWSVTAVLGAAFLLLISLVINAVIAALATYMSGFLPGGATLWSAVNLGVSLGVITLLFACMFKYLPDVRITWHDVWIGAALTAVLFTVGKFAIGLYLGKSTFGSTFGAAASLVVLLLWVYYSAQILFFGAEFTKVYANRYGSRIKPDENAEPLTPEARARQGLQPPASRPEPGRAHGKEPPKGPPTYFS